MINKLVYTLSVIMITGFWVNEIWEYGYLQIILGQLAGFGLGWTIRQILD